MFKSQRASPATLEETLLTLSAPISVFVLDGAWLVAGPSGLFVLTQDDGDLPAATARASALADAVRLELSDQLVWVPFVDAMCASAEVGVDDQPCLVIPHDLVVPTVSAGPHTLDAETLTKLGTLRYPILR